MKISRSGVIYKFHLGALALFLFSEVLAAPIGFLVTGLGVPVLQYFPKIILSLCFFTAVLSLAKSTSIWQLATLYCFMLFYSLVGLFYHKDPVRVLFGWWEWMPFLFGLVYGLHYSALNRDLNSVVILCFCILLFGLVMDYLFELPFLDVGFNVLGSEVLLQKEMTTFEILRHNGFSNSAFLAANSAVCFAAIVVCYRRKIGVTVPALLALVLTLTLIKSVILGSVFLIGGFFLLYRWRGPWNFLVPVSVLTFGLFVFVAGSVFLSTAESSETAYFFFRSLGDRTFFTWPLFLDLFESWDRWIFGFGFGGVGLGAKAAQNAVYYADNFLLYFIGNFGLFGLLLLVFVLCLPSYSLSEDETLLIRVLLSSLFAVGVAVDMWSDPCYGLFSGICLGALMRGSTRRLWSASSYSQYS